MEPYYHMLKVAQSVQCSIPKTSVELEARMLIPERIPWEPDESFSIQYYKCSQHPYLTIRKREDGLFETKELVTRIHDGPVRLVCSIEKEYSRFPASLVKHTLRHLSRKVIHQYPYTTITCEQGIFTLEIEYDETSVRHCVDQLRAYQLPFWPAPKPRDAYASELLSHFSEGWTLSTKLDGIHVVVYDDIAIDDGGHLYTFGKDRTIPPSDALNIGEGELLGDGRLVLFDVLRREGREITQLPYLERLKWSWRDTKPVYAFKTHAELVEAAARIREGGNYPSDGWILTSQGARVDLVYKSKPLPTVDLQYIQGYLYLASESRSSRASPSPLEEGKIYEFDLNLNLLGERPDKLTPNMYMPVETDPLAHILSGQGIPCLRYHHNAVKMKLLQKLPKTTLLDIGSGVGGDLDKWKELQFKHVFAVDQQIRLRHRPPFVTSLRSQAQDINRDLRFDSISMFFVPWCESFLPLFKRAKHVVLILMDNPVPLQTEICRVSIEQRKIILEIPNSLSAAHVEEPIPDTDSLAKAMAAAGFQERRFVYPLGFGSEPEKQLASMYTYIYYFK